MLFNEAEICRETTEPESETEAIRIDVKSYQRKSKRTKAELTKDLPQKDIYYELPEEALHDEEGNHYEYVSTNLVRNEMMIIYDGSSHGFRSMDRGKNHVRCSSADIENGLFIFQEGIPENS